MATQPITYDIKQAHQPKPINRPPNESPFNDGWGSTLVPMSIEAEEAVIGSMLLNPDCFATIKTFLQPDDFFILRHKYIYETMNRLNERKDAIDYITVTNELKAVDRLNEIGGAAYLMHLLSATPTSIHAETYGRLVQRCAVRRRLMVASDHIKGLALNEELTVEQVFVEMDKKLVDVKGVDLGRKEVGLKALLNQSMDYVEQRMANPTILPGIPMAIKAENDIILGAEKQNLIVYAGVPGMGKTSKMLTDMLHMARLGKKCGFFTYEMSEAEITQRLLSLESDVNLLHIRKGDLSTSSDKDVFGRKDEFGRFVEAAGRLAKLADNIHICDTRPTIKGIQAKCLSWMNEFGLDVVFIDYLQIIRSDGRYSPNQRTQEVDYFAYSLKNEIAADLNLPVIVGAQLNREIAKRQDKRPVLDDLRESGAIEQAADKVIFIYRDEYYNETTESPNQADLIVRKHRNGPTGTAVAYFEKTTTAFKNASDRSVDLSHI